MQHARGTTDLARKFLLVVADHPNDLDPTMHNITKGQTLLFFLIYDEIKTLSA